MKSLLLFTLCSLCTFAPFAALAEDGIAKLKTPEVVNLTTSIVTTEYVVVKLSNQVLVDNHENPTSIDLLSDLDLHRVPTSLQPTYHLQLQLK